MTATFTHEMARTNAKNRATRQEQDIFRGCGYQVDSNMSTDHILQSIGLDWSFAKSSIRYGGMFENHTNARQVLYRVQDGMYMDTVGPDWDAPAFADTINLFREFSDQCNLNLEQVGAIVKSDYVNDSPQLKTTLFAAASFGSDTRFTLPGEDLVEGKIIMRLPYIFGFGLSVGLLADRKICTNGMCALVSDNLIISHRNLNMDKVQNVMQKARIKWENQQQQFELLSQTVMPKDVAVMELIKQFGDPAKDLKDQNKVVQQAIAQFENSSFIGGDMLSAYNTAWGLLNVVTQYYNHNYGRQKTSVNLAERVINPSSAINVKQAEFLKSISAFAWAERNKQATGQSVAVRAWQ